MTGFGSTVGKCIICVLSSACCSDLVPPTLSISLSRHRERHFWKSCTWVETQPLLLLSTSQRHRGGSGCLSFGLTPTQTSAAGLDPQAEGRAFALSWQCQKTQDLIHTCALKLLNSTMPQRTPWSADGVKERCTGTFIRIRTAHLSTPASCWEVSELCSCWVPHQPAPPSRALLPCCSTLPLLLSNIRGWEQGDRTEGLSQNHHLHPLPKVPACSLSALAQTPLPGSISTLALKLHF